MQETNPIPWKHKALSWLILAALSTFFAEVWSGSEMFPFFKPWGLLVVVPLYGLHLLILAGFAVHYLNPNFSTLLYLGMIFGLYEAYITKVLWNPPWGDAWIVAGMAPVETVVLVFWWHAWFSFILPLVIGQQILTREQTLAGLLPPKITHMVTSKIGLILLVICGGVFQSLNSPSPIHSLLSGVSTVGVLAGLILLWKRLTQNKAYALPNLLPDKQELRWLLVPLGLMYLIMSLVLRPDAFPPFVGHLLIWLIYGLITFLLAVNQRNLSNLTGRQQSSTSTDVKGKAWWKVALLFPLSATLAELLLSPIDQGIAVIAWIGGILFGLTMFFIAFKETLSKQGTPRHETT